jgi:hypothetical protein
MQIYLLVVQKLLKCAWSFGNVKCTILLQNAFITLVHYEQRMISYSGLDHRA